MLINNCRYFAVFFLLAVCQFSYASPSQIATGGVIIDYDADTFSANTDSFHISGSLMDVVPVSNGVKLNFNNLLTLSASSGIFFSADYKAGDYSALFSFSPTPGHTITGYSITYEGIYTIETPGFIGVSGPGGGFSSSSSAFSLLFSETVNTVGSIAPALSGSLAAEAYIDIIQVSDGFFQVQTGTQTVLDYCEDFDPNICYYREEPVYEWVERFHDESDLGDASINLQSITITANVSAVPLPGGFVLFGSVLSLIGGFKLRRKQAFF